MESKVTDTRKRDERRALKGAPMRFPKAWSVVVDTACDLFESRPGTRGSRPQSG
ncbi:hypothetical protein [Streptacidiphilus sp. PAMC 29251]